MCIGPTIALPRGPADTTASAREHRASSGWQAGCAAPGARSLALWVQDSMVALLLRFHCDTLAQAVQANGSFKAAKMCANNDCALDRDVEDESVGNPAPIDGNLSMLVHACWCLSPNSQQSSFLRVLANLRAAS